MEKGWSFWMERSGNTWGAIEIVGRERKNVAVTKRVADLRLIPDGEQGYRKARCDRLKARDIPKGLRR